MKKEINGWVHIFERNGKYYPGVIFQTKKDAQFYRGQKVVLGNNCVALVKIPTIRFKKGEGLNEKHKTVKDS